MEPRAIIEDKTMIFRCQINLLLVYKDCIFYAQHLYLLCETYILFQLLHGHPGSNQMNQNVEPKTFFYEVKSIYNVKIRGC